ESCAVAQSCRCRSRRARQSAIDAACVGYDGGRFLSRIGIADQLHGTVSCCFRKRTSGRRCRDSESVMGTQSRCSDAPHQNAPDTGRANAASACARPWRRSVDFRSRIHGHCLQCPECCAGSDNDRNLHFCLHSTKTHQYREYGGWRNSWCDSADDRLGGSARTYRSGSVKPLRDRLFVAIAAFLCHRVDVPRRLFAGWVSHDFERRPQRRTQRQPERVFLYPAPGDSRSPCLSWNCEFCLPCNRAFARRFVHCRCDAFSTDPHARRSAFIVHRLDRLSSTVTRGAGSDEIMNTTFVATDRAPTRSGIAWKVTLILIPLITLGLLLWLRQLEVNALQQRAVSSYGTVPSFQLINQNGQPFGSAQLAGKIWIADFIY